MAEGGLADRWYVLQRIWLEWQGLNVGVMALAAAVAAYIISQHQLLDSRLARQDEIERKRLATSAVLPTVLDAFCDYASDLISVVARAEHEVELQRSGKSFEPTLIETPVLSPEILVLLRDAIEYSERDVALSFKRLISFQQVCSARFRSKIDSINQDNLSSSIRSFDSILANAAALFAVAEIFFAYARDEGKLVSETVGVNDIWGVLNRNNIERERRPDLEIEVGASALQVRSIVN